MLAIRYNNWYVSSAIRGKIMSWKFRTRLAELRKERGVERMEFVRKAGLAYTTVLNWENDLLHSIDANKLKQVMDLLEVDNLSEFIEFVEVEDNNR